MVVSIISLCISFLAHSVKPSPGWLMVLVGVVSLLLLLLPLEGESSSWPVWLHVTTNMKLIAAFALGQ